MSELQEPILTSIEHSARVISSLKDQVGVIEDITNAIIAALKQGNKILTAGHGGSAAEALHMAEELVGRFKRDRVALPAIALVADSTLLTCIGNDYGFEKIFPRQVEAHGRAGDVLVVFSTSGNGPGFQQVVKVAAERSVRTIALLGKGGGELSGRCELELIVQDDETARIQEAHQVVMHVILEAVDAQFA